jgi:hypothetical protein
MCIAVSLLTALNAIAVWPQMLRFCPFLAHQKPDVPRGTNRFVLLFIVAGAAPRLS